MPAPNLFLDLSKQLSQKIDAESSHAEYLAQDYDSLFEERPVSLATFLYDKKFMALPSLSDKQFAFVAAGTQIYYQSTLELLKWEPIPYYKMLVAKWGKGSGKDTVSRIILARIAYLLICLRNPQKYLNIMPGDSINMLNVAYSARQAQEIFFDPLKRVISKSLWFRNKFTHVEDRLRFIKDVNLVSGHSEQESMEGHNLLVAVLDEIAAFKTEAELAYRQRRSVRALEHSAEALADMVTSSATSRFPFLHKIIYISYTRFQGDFIEQKYNEGLKTPRTSFVSWGATWDINPTKSRSDFDDEYERNPENAASRYECKPPKATDAYFKQITPELIAEVFPVIEEPFLDNPTRPLLRPEFFGIEGLMYFAHIDLALSKDRAGLCVCHRAGFEIREIKQTNEEGIEWYEQIRLPKIKVDLWTSVTAPPGGEVDFEMIRLLLFELHDRRRCRLGMVTFDQFQSADSIQLLTKHGIQADTLSVDRDTKCYDTLKDFMYTRRLQAYYRARGIDELERLNIVNGNKIDHPLSGSKDEADALAGAVYNASIAEVADVCVDDITTGFAYNEMFEDYHMNEMHKIWTPEHFEGKVKY